MERHGLDEEIEEKEILKESASVSSEKKDEKENVEKSSSAAHSAETTETLNQESAEVAIDETEKKNIIQSSAGQSTETTETLNQESAEVAIDETEKKNIIQPSAGQSTETTETLNRESVKGVTGETDETISAQASVSFYISDSEDTDEKYSRSQKRKQYFKSRRFFSPKLKVKETKQSKKQEVCTHKHTNVSSQIEVKETKLSETSRDNQLDTSSPTVKIEENETKPKKLSSSIRLMRKLVTALQRLKRKPEESSAQLTDTTESTKNTGDSADEPNEATQAEASAGDRSLYIPDSVITNEKCGLSEKRNEFYPAKDSRSKSGMVLEKMKKWKKKKKDDTSYKNHEVMFKKVLEEEVDPESGELKERKEEKSESESKLHRKLLEKKQKSPTAVVISTNATNKQENNSSGFEKKADCSTPQICSENNYSELLKEAQYQIPELEPSTLINDGSVRAKISQKLKKEKCSSDTSSDEDPQIKQKNSPSSEPKLQEELLPEIEDPVELILEISEIPYEDSNPNVRIYLSNFPASLPSNFETVLELMKQGPQQEEGAAAAASEVPLQRLEIPEKIRDWLARDASHIERNELISRIPVTVERILINYHLAREEDETISPQHLKDFVIAITKAINNYLPFIFLYEIERNQFNEISQRIPYAMAAQIYGATNLTRLLIVLGSYLAFDVFEAADLEVIDRLIGDFMRYLCENFPRTFREERSLSRKPENKR